jgi:hypothetical protein
VGVSLVSGALNNNADGTVGWNDLPSEQPSTLDQILDALSPEGTAWADTWSCTGGSITPAWNGPGSYTYVPVSCTVTWGNNKMASSSWSGAFDVTYGASCTGVTARLFQQPAGCAMTRTTVAGGATRTVTGPDGTVYVISHDTNGASTGWDNTVSPAPNNLGVVATCGTGGCSQGGTLVINGSHIVGMVTPAGGTQAKYWDHTVSTGANGLAVSISGADRIVNGVVTVQHNLAMYTATITFKDVTYSDLTCCFPTSGSVTTSFDGGPHKSETESMDFSPLCGVAQLTRSDGGKEPYELRHCL